MPKKGNNPRGVGSSIISIIIFLMILFVPFLGINLTQRIRQGDGKFDFDEELCFDIDKESQFKNDWIEPPSTGIGSLKYSYVVNPNVAKVHHSKMNLLTNPLNGTVDGYGVGSATPNTGDIPVVPVGGNSIQFALNITKETILDLDITRIDIFLFISGVTFTEMDFRMQDISRSTSFLLIEDDMKIGNITKIKIDVIDLLKINTLKDNDELLFMFVGNPGDFIPGNSFVVFDMQFYCIPEIVTPSLTKVSLWISATALFVIFMGFIVSPEISFEGVLNSMASAMTRRP